MCYEALLVFPQCLSIRDVEALKFGEMIKFKAILAMDYEVLMAFSTSMYCLKLETPDLYENPKGLVKRVAWGLGNFSTRNPIYCCKRTHSLVVQ